MSLGISGGITNPIHGIPYSVHFISSGAAGPVVWSQPSGTLPTGLSFSSGLLSGTPSALGYFVFTIQATDGVETVSQEYVVQVLTDVELVITRASTGEKYTVVIPTAIAQIWDYIANNMFDAGVPIYTVDGTNPNGLNVFYKDVLDLMVQTWQSKYTNLQTKAAAQQISQSISSTVKNVIVTKIQ